MSKDINRVVLEGCLGADPVVRVAPQTRKEMASAALYTNYSVRNGNDWETRSERHNLVFYEDNAKKAREYKKGHRLNITGYNRTRKYQDKDTKFDKYITEVVVTQVEYVMRSVGTAEKTDASYPTVANG